MDEMQIITEIIKSLNDMQKNLYEQLHILVETSKTCDNASDLIALNKEIFQVVAAIFKILELNAQYKNGIME